MIFLNKDFSRTGYLEEFHGLEKRSIRKYINFLFDFLRNGVDVEQFQTRTKSLLDEASTFFFKKIARCQPFLLVVAAETV